MTELKIRRRRDRLAMTLTELKQQASIEFNSVLLEQLASTHQ